MLEWEKRSNELEAGLPKIGRYPASGLVRRARRLVDLSQRQFAKFAHVSVSTVSKVESGAMAPSLNVLQHMLAAAGLYLVVVDQDGRVIEPMRDIDDTRDGADRRYPAHLDVILDPRQGEWWGDWYGLARPPETFYRSRERRDIQRARSQWETRAKQFRNVPAPPDLEGLDFLREQARQRGLRPLGAETPDDIDWDAEGWDVEEWEGEEPAGDTEELLDEALVGPIPADLPRAGEPQLDVAEETDMRTDGESADGAPPAPPAPPASTESGDDTATGAVPRR